MISASGEPEGHGSDIYLRMQNIVVRLAIFGQSQTPQNPQNPELVFAMA